MVELCFVEVLPLKMLYSLGLSLWGSGSLGFALVRFILVGVLTCLDCPIIFCPCNIRLLSWLSVLVASRPSCPW